jgi:co-chaperonin GroES (HSP10)
MKPFNDKLKVLLAQVGPFGDPNSGTESGLVVEVPDELIYFAFHSSLFDESLGNTEVLKQVQAFYKKLEGKTVYWESLQDRGRRFKEGDDEYVLLNMSDVIAFSDSDESVATIIDQTGKAGSFNL